MLREQIRVTMRLPIHIKIYRINNIKSMLNTTDAYVKGVEVVQDIPYEDCELFVASYNRKGSILTASQLARYIQAQFGNGDYKLKGWVRGNKKKGLKGVYSFIILGSFEIRESYWRLIPKMNDKITITSKLQKEFKYELKALKDLKRQLKDAVKFNDTKFEQELRDDIMDILSMFEDAKAVYRDDNENNDLLVKKKTKRKSKRGLFPYFRNILPMNSKHIYHEPNDFSEFNPKGKLIERGGKITQSKEESLTERESDLDFVCGELSRKNKKEVNETEQIANIIKNQKNDDKVDDYSFIK